MRKLIKMVLGKFINMETAEETRLRVRREFAENTRVGLFANMLQEGEHNSARVVNREW